MKKMKLILSMMLCAALLCGIPAAGAELVRTGITVTGVIQSEDGSTRQTTVEGSFRVFVNGQETAIVKAGQDTLTLNTEDRIRLEPIPQSFLPEWDLSTAYVTADSAAVASGTLQVTVYRRDTSKPTEVPPPTGTPVIPAETEGIPEIPTPEAMPSETPAATPVPPEETEGPSMPAGPEAVVTPTLAPYVPEDSTTPEPVLKGLEDSGETGSLRVQVFNDKNGNGVQGNFESGIRNIAVYLLDAREEALLCVTTDAQGMAVFTDVPAGEYRTRVILPEDYYFTKAAGENDLARSAFGPCAGGSQTSGPVQVAAGTETQQGAGIHSGAGIYSGVCWLENVTDGLYKSDEQTIPGITIRMVYQDGEDLTYETVSDGQGSWKITNLRPGYYVISASTPEGMMMARYTQTRGRRSYLTSDNPRRRQIVNVGSVTTDCNIGYNWSAVVRGICYLDANYNGIYDEGELPLKGVKVYALFAYDGAEAAKAVSGEDGRYTLTGMRGNYYTMTTLLPEGGYLYTRTAMGDPKGNYFYARGDARAATLKGLNLRDAEQREMNIGAILPGKVTGTVYYDDDFSAARDGKEKVATGFVVTLRDADGNPAGTDRTDARGIYEIDGLTPGEYSLDVTAVSGYAFTKRGEGNVILNRTGGAGYSEPFRVELGAEASGMDIGMIRPGTVEGTVFADLNDNGMREADENGLKGVVVRLMSDEGEAFRAEIDERGRFLFDAVMPGRYWVEYELPEYTVFAVTAEGGNRISGEGRTARTETFDFATGDLWQAPLCGALTLSRMEGLAYQDHNGSGIRDEGEETLAGVTVRLIPGRTDLETVTAVTAEDGSFRIEDIRPDTYELEVVCPESFVASRTDHLQLPVRAGLNTQRAALPAPMGSAWTQQEIGAVIPAALRGRIWMDENRNGRYDEGEKTPAGYTVTVTDEATGTVFDTPVTDGEGKFSAEGMIPGSFAVSLPLDERTLGTVPGDSVFTEEEGMLALRGIVLQENELREGLNLGIIRYTEISGRAWIDRGGQLESLAGMRIEMKDEQGGLIAETETDATGAYRLTKLMPCEFRLEVTAPEGCVLIEPGDPRLTEEIRSAAVSTSNRTGATESMSLRMDEDREQVDFGCVLPGRLGDWCWVDLNGDGLQAGDEPGIPNLHIELTRDGQTVAETTTNEYGFYRFVDLYPAEYVLRVRVPAEVRPTEHRTDLKMIASVLREDDGETVESYPVTVVSNRNQYDADLGFVCRQDGVLPAGAGEGTAQEWTPKY